MSTLLDSLLKRALPKPRDTTPVLFRGAYLPKWRVDELRRTWPAYVDGLFGAWTTKHCEYVFIDD